MNADTRKLLPEIGWGALFGAAAWSAYAVAEFVFSSLVFRLTRPYAQFPAWHWRLTIVVVLGYIAFGLLAGAAAGLAVALRRGRDTKQSLPDLLEAAAGLTVALAMTVNLLTGQGARTGTGAQLAISMFCAVLLILGLRSAVWRDRLGWLTNTWVIAAMWLGTGLAFAIRRSGVASQLGKRLDVPAALISAALVLVAASALFLGRIARRHPSAGRWPLRFAVFSGALAGLLLAVSAVLAFNTPAAAESGGNASSTRPNLVMIVMDTVRADHVSLNGYGRDTTPQLKALAQDSVTYKNAFSASDITLTSHASLFTGMYPSWHGAYSLPPEAVYGLELSTKYPTIAELLDGHGYETVGVAANLYLRPEFGLERGFDQFRIPRPVPMLTDENRYLLRYRLRRLLGLFVDSAQFDRLYTFGEDIDHELFTILDQRSRSHDPFFVFLNYMDAHFPYVPPAPFNSRFPGKRATMTQDDLEAEMDVIADGKEIPAGYRLHCESQYDGGIAYMDGQVGRVVDWLKRHNAYDNTMIVVTSDHGESFGEKHRVGHGNSPYQNLLHVPLLIKYPHSVRRGTESQPVSLVDVAPTVLATLNLPVPAPMQGVTLAGGAPAPRRIFAETFQNPVSHSPDCPDGCVAKVVVAWPLKFVRNLTNGKPEFFDIAADMHEEHNLFATQQDRAKPLESYLAEWSKDLPTQARKNVRITRDVENALKGNGYFQK
jgi:arylsulfatase A-like enzyme